MNVVTRGIKNATRSPIKSGAIVLMFAISIALVLSMLVARGSVLAKIEEIKASAGTSVTISPAGVMGLMGGGDPLTAEQIETIQNTEHISSTTMTLSDQLGTDDSDLESSIELGAFGERQMRFEGESTQTMPEGEAENAARPTPGSRISVTGTNDVNSAATDGGELTLTAGEAFSADSTSNEAVIGTALAEKNELAVGDTFTAYGETITVIGIYETGSTFQDGGVIMPLATLQTLTDQADAVSSIVATVDSSDNVATVVSSLEASLGDDADITSDTERAESSVTSLQGIADLTLAGVIGAAAAGGVIVLLAMIMIVRERRREIGVMKAIGGSNAKIMGQFTVEGLTLTVFGAMIGILFGILVSGPMTTSLVSNSQESTATTQQSQGPGGGMGGGASGERPDFGGAVRGGFEQLNTNVTQITATLTPQILFAAIGITALIAVLGSAIPAWLTARIRPAEVLRTE